MYCNFHISDRNSSSTTIIELLPNRNFGVISRVKYYWFHDHKIGSISNLFCFYDFYSWNGDCSSFSCQTRITIFEYYPIPSWDIYLHCFERQPIVTHRKFKAQNVSIWPFSETSTDLAQMKSNEEYINNLGRARCFENI